MDEDLEAYFGRIEACFCAQRGAPLLLSPLDFEKALEWHAAGIPIEAIEEGVGRYFLRLDARKTPRRRAICLSFAQDQIFKVLEERRAAAVGRAAGATEPGDAEGSVRRFLESRIAALDAFLEDPAREGTHPILSRAIRGARTELESLLSRAGEAAEALESVLAPLDQEIASLALLESPSQDAEAWRRAALGRLGPFAAGMEAAALRSATERLARQEALRSLGLVRLSLLFMEA